FPRSAAEWSNLNRDSELYGGLEATWQELSADAPTMGAHCGAKVPVISFGAGDGVRDRQLMTAFKDKGRECLYFPVDASQAMLEMACAGAEDDEFETVGIKADISSPVHLVYAADAAEPPRLFIMSGNTVGSFDPLAEVRYIAQCMKPGDRLIIDGELYDEQKTMGRRDNPAARKFLMSLLNSVGIGPEDGELRFNAKRDDRHAGLHLITRYYRAEQDISATVASQEIAIERGERIGLNFQYTYTPAAFHWLVSEHGGLDIVKEYRSSDERFLTLICKR